MNWLHHTLTYIKNLAKPLLSARSYIPYSGYISWWQIFVFQQQTNFCAVIASSAPFTLQSATPILRNFRSLDSFLNEKKQKLNPTKITHYNMVVVQELKIRFQSSIDYCCHFHEYHPILFNTHSICNFSRMRGKFPLYPSSMELFIIGPGESFRI